MKNFLRLHNQFASTTRAKAGNKSGLTLVSSSGEMEALLLLDETGFEEHCLAFYGHC
jgi:hypothetical protein